MMLGDIGLDAETACFRIHLDFSDCVHIAGSQPAVSTSPGPEGDVSLRRYLYVIVVCQTPLTCSGGSSA